MTLAEWVAARIRSESDISAVEAITADLIRVRRKSNGEVLVGTLAMQIVTLDVLKSFIEQHPGTVFVINVPKKSRFAGDALVFAKQNNVAIGHLNDLRHALRLPNPGSYVDRETTFAEVSLGQHSRVKSFTRLDDSRYVIQRRGLRDVTVVFLYEYDISVDSVRTVIARYGPFQAIVKTNRNGNISAMASAAATSAGRRILKWQEFFKELHREWK